MNVQTALTGALIAIVGWSFAVTGWRAVRPRGAVPAGDADVAFAPATPAGSAVGWRIFYGILGLFGLFAAGCGLLLAFGGLFME